MKRLDAARALVAHIAERLDADLSIELWNGERLPLGTRTPRDELRIVVRSADAVGRLLRHPRLKTVFELYAGGDLDVAGGTPLDVLGRWEHLKAVGLRKSLDKRLLARAALPFLLKPRARGASPGWAGRIGRIFGRGREDAELIRFHYDVSNDFYGLFLDPEMQYSCAVFTDGSESLADAQRRKMDLICRKLRLKRGDRLLDIGCGWGGLAAHAARDYGAIVHGVTLSAEQLAFAQAKIAALGLTDRVTLELRDYRSIETPEAYDKIVQIEMFEHVGLDNHDRQFEKVRDLLKPRGLYLHQATTRRATRDIARFRKPTAYQGVINRFIFPGGELDHIGMSVTNLERLGFEVHDVESFREHYVRTLKMWSDRLYANRVAAEAEIGAARTRLWQLYFALFGLGFERVLCGNFQTLASKRQPGASGLPLSGAPRA
ncbi:MAG: SAM-dependent methyltransferase [Sphingomonas bacterium]|nr:SAM-dependent methyltransferase [Sphingomonas bacterium]